MFRKAYHIVLSMLLLISTTGFAFSKHYCGEELVSTSFIVKADPCCNSGNCCRNEIEIFKLEEDFVLSAVVEIPESIHLELFALIPFVLNLDLNEVAAENQLIISASPPLEERQTTLARKQSYLL